MRKLLLPFLLALLALSATSFTTGTSDNASDDNAIQWLSWEEAMTKQEKQPKAIMVFVHTKWCGWCDRMKKSTFSEPHLIDYINKNFYAVSLDAEQKEAIKFKDEVYKFVNKGRRGYHEFASKITSGRLSYPTTVFLDKDLEVLQPIPGYQKAEVFEKIVTYFGGDFYRNTPWEKYEKSYVPMPRKQLISD